LPSGDFTNALKASLERKGAVMSALLGSVNLPIVREIACLLDEFVVDSPVSMMQIVVYTSSCNIKDTGN
jgi:hypothetical protein